MNIPTNEFEFLNEFFLDVRTFVKTSSVFQFPGDQLVDSPKYKLSERSKSNPFRWLALVLAFVTQKTNAFGDLAGHAM
ncbi:hypothetical protein HKB03_00750 [Escherichia coli]|nr:hypothetical protein [Escherichia coli]MBF2915129.1 hypothetical protein [Escherichia coli]